MLTVKNSMEENSVLSYGPRPESMQCVWLVKKGPGQKVLKGHMTHSLSWENNSVPVLLTVEYLGRGPYHAVGRSHWPVWVFSTMFTHLATGFHQMHHQEYKGQKYNRNQRAPVVKRENDVWKAGQTCFLPGPVAYCVRQERKISVTICETWNRNSKSCVQHQRIHCYKILHNTPV